MENVENTVRERITSKIVSQADGKIGNLVGDKVWIKVRDPIIEQTSDQLWIQVINPILEQTSDQLMEQVKQNVKL
jgi:hypothetical protein